jgi:hypothetical protein
MREAAGGRDAGPEEQAHQTDGRAQSHARAGPRSQVSTPSCSCSVGGSVSDPDSLSPDPDPEFRLITDPDPGFCHFFYQKLQFTCTFTYPYPPYPSIKNV